jgi:probable HAF family extracellular repeat protein
LKTSLCRIIVAILAATLFFLSEAQARTYNYTYFDVPGANATMAYGINNAGTIVGFYYQNGYHGFVKTAGGSYTPIDVPGATDTFIYGINANGRIVGGYGNPQVYTSGHGFIYDNGTYTYPFDVLPVSFGTYPAGINLAGQIVGQYSEDGTIPGIRGFLWSGGSFTTLGAPAVIEPRGINDAGWIVGTYGDANESNRGFIVAPDGAASPFDVPGATHTFISGINNHRWLSGSYRHDDGISHGFFHDGLAFSYIDVPGAFETRVQGINDRGQVVGAYKDAGGVYHGFIATPARDISGLLLLLLGD